MLTRRTFLTHTAAAGAVAAASAQAGAADAREESAASSASLATHRIPRTDLEVSRICYGGAALGGRNRDPLSADQIDTGRRLIHAAADQGINFFDLADIYCFGKSEAVLGEAIKNSPGLRNKIVIQSKCGQTETTFNSSYEYIVRAVEGSLRRLNTDRLDVLLLHFPDHLVVPEQVARAFDELERAGKVRYFGVSNHTPEQIELLRKNVSQPLVINQIQISLLNYFSAAGTVEYCRLHDMQVQAYSPVRGLVNMDAGASEATKKLLSLMTEIGGRKNVTATATIGLAWLLKHPAAIVPIIGTMDVEHIAENCSAARVDLTREEWYAMLFAGAKIQQPG